MAIKAIPSFQQTNSMPHALIKISWTTDDKGRFNGKAVGGICGTCFTLESGVTLTAAQLTWGLFDPNPGFDACRVFVAGNAGALVELTPRQIRLDPVHELAIITGCILPSSIPLASPSNPLGQSHAIGYCANIAPFQTAVSRSGKKLTITDLHLVKARQIVHIPILHPTPLHVATDDINLDGVPGFIFAAPSLPGMAGAPVIDDSTGCCVGVCVFGLPPDHAEKTHLGAVDIRRLPLAGSAHGRHA